jgi:nicotinic acid mononucleotide adenylyltransferase
MDHPDEEDEFVLDAIIKSRYLDDGTTEYQCVVRSTVTQVQGRHWLCVEDVEEYANSLTRLRDFRNRGLSKKTNKKIVGIVNAPPIAVPVSSSAVVGTDLAVNVTKLMHRGEGTRCKEAILFFAGSFNPPHLGHLSVMEEAAAYLEHIHQGGGVYKVVGGYFTPTSTAGAIDKLGPLALSGEHRIRMIDAMLHDNARWSVFDWLANQPRNEGVRKAREELENRLMAFFANAKLPCPELVVVCGADSLDGIRKVALQRLVICVNNRSSNIDVDLDGEEMIKTI